MIRYGAPFIRMSIGCTCFSKNMIEHSSPSLGKEERCATLEVIKTNFIAEGKEVSRFEEELSSYIGASGGVATSTGTLALYLGLLSLDLAKNDEIIIPSYVCRSVLNSVLYLRAKPILCDVNRQDYNICLDEARSKVSKKTKAVIIPHMYGCPAEICNFVEEFRDLGIYIIEDCAHSIGAKCKGRKVGSFGDLSIFSFEGTKYIVTGEGGMVLANSKALLGRLRKLKEPDSFDYKTKYTYRMTDLQAAIGRVQLSKLKKFINKRREIARVYNNAFLGLGIDLPKDFPERQHIFHRYMIQIKSDIHAFMKRCYKGGVKVKQPVKPYPLYRYLNLSAKRFPNTEYIMNSSVSVPIYPSLTSRQIERIIDVIKSAF